MPRKALLLLALVLALALPAASAAAAPQRHVLPNGLTVITSENHEAPVVSFQVWVRAGSAFERKGEYGITHLIEHMIFKGTPSDPQGRMAGRIEALGGEVNAYTTFDHTNYYVSVASRYAGQALDLLADAVVHASFDPKELAREKEVVVEEIRMNQDSPARRRSRALLALAFGDYPYGRPVIGSIESVRAITRQDILDYRARWYRAPNMLVVAVGDFDTASILKRIEKDFQDLPRQPAPPFELPRVKLPAGPRLKVMREKVHQASVLLAWRIPGLPHRDTYALDMAAAVAGEGATSRLYSQLKERRGLVDGVSAGAWTPRGIGLFEVSASLAPGKVAAAWKPLLQQTLSLISRPPSPDELKRARVNLSAEFIRSRQSMSGQARMLGYFEMLRGGFEKMQTYLERFRATGSAQVVEAARAYFTPRRLSVVIQLPRDAPAPSQEELARAVRRIRAAVHPPAREEKALLTRLPNGLTLVVQPRRALPLVAFNLVAPGGQEAEGPGQAGLYDLWSRTITRGSQKRSYQDIIGELESLAASLEGYSGKSTCGLSGSFLAPDWKRGLEILAELWLAPGFVPEQIERARAEQLAALRSRENSPVARAFMAFRKLIYGKHPYAQDPLGTVKTIKSFSRQDLLAAHRRVRGPGGLVLTVVGDVDVQEVQKEVRRLLGREPGRVRPPRKIPVRPPAKALIRAIKDPKAKQTQIILGYVAPSSLDPRRFGLRILDAVLGGQGGRLFSDLRDKLSLAYAVQPFYSAAPRGGVFGVYMGVGPGKEKEALAGLARHLEALRQKPPSPTEMKRAKGYILGTWAIGLQNYQALAALMARDQLLGLGYDYYRKMPRRIEAVSAEKVLEAARRYLDPKHQALTTLGP